MVASARHVRRKRPDLIADDLKRLVVTARFSPGDRLPREAELMAHYGCSRGTIREALKSLEVQGIVEVLPGPGGGARVLAGDIERATELLRNLFYFESLTAADLYALREVLEPPIVEAVAGRLGEEDFRALAETVQICREGRHGQVDVDAHRRAEIEFHMVLARKAPNSLWRFFAVFVLSLLESLVAPKAVAQGTNDIFACHTLEAHEEILAALRAGDGLRARAAMERHIAAAGRMAVQIETAFDRERLLSRSAPAAGRPLRGGG